ncbi:MAG: hypothetical protein ABUK01_13750 [Leptospirales bacterium]
MLIKKTKCNNCGSSKMKLSATAYVYCDYCASLIDFDLSKFLGISGSSLHKMTSQASEAGQLANESKQMKLAEQVSEKADTMYLAKVKEHKEVSDKLSPLLQAALADGDREKYEELCKELQEHYVISSGSTLSPRVGDPRYKEKFVKYLVLTTTERNFNPGLVELTSDLGKVTAAIKWDMSDPAAMAIPVSDFKAMIQSYTAFLDGCNRKYAELGYFEYEPERMGPELVKEIALSTFVQAWVPYIKKDELRGILEEFNLLGEYQELPNVKLNERICGQCGNMLLVAENAKKTLCECCGYIMDTENINFDCPGCTAPVSFPLDKEEFNCPSCQTLIQK